MRISDQEYNRLRILKTIRRAEPVSRTELAQLTGLAGGTITEVVGNLVARKVLLEEKIAASRLGRPRIGLRLNPEAAYVVSAHLRNDGTFAIDLVNARGDAVARETLAFPRKSTIEALAEQIAEGIEQSIARSGVRRSSIARVGVALPAILDNRSGVLHWMMTYPAGPTPVAEQLTARLGIPVVVDNTVNDLARAEHWFGDDRQLDDFTLIVFDGWIGLAQYVDGQLWSGGQGINAEFAHVKLGLQEGRRCMCGAHDCLGTHASIVAIVAQVCERRGETWPNLTLIDGLIRQYASEAKAGEPITAEVFERAGMLLGRAVGNYINVWNPARVLLLTTSADVLEVMEAPFRAGLREAALPLLLDRVNVQWQVRDAMRHAEGAAALVLEQLYRVPNSGGAPRVRKGRAASA